MDDKIRKNSFDVYDRLRYERINEKDLKVNKDMDLDEMIDPEIESKIKISPEIAPRKVLLSDIAKEVMKHGYLAGDRGTRQGIDYYINETTLFGKVEIIEPKEPLIIRGGFFWKDKYSLERNGSIIGAVNIEGMIYKSNPKAWIIEAYGKESIPKLQSLARRLVKKFNVDIEINLEKEIIEEEKDRFNLTYNLGRLYKYRDMIHLPPIKRRIE